jgi:nucleoside-diphosphate kinase
MIEETLAIIKTDGVKQERKIVERILDEKYDITFQQKVLITPDVARNFYSHVHPEGRLRHEDKNYAVRMSIFNDLVNCMTENYARVMLLEKKYGNTISSFKKLVGHTDPMKAGPGTIKGDYGLDDKSIADEQWRSVRNLIHASGTPEEVEREKKILSEVVRFPIPKMDVSLLMNAYCLMKGERPKYYMDGNGGVKRFSFEKNGFLIESKRNFYFDRTEEFELRIFYNERMKNFFDSLLNDFCNEDIVLEMSGNSISYFNKGPWLDDLEKLIDEENRVSVFI